MLVAVRLLTATIHLCCKKPTVHTHATQLSAMLLTCPPVASVGNILNRLCIVVSRWL